MYVHPEISTARDVGRTRLESGLFISPGEFSTDWNTSYDQLDIVAPGRIANVVARPTEEDDELDECCRSLVSPAVYDPREEDDHIEVTPSAETSYGRREYHSLPSSLHLVRPYIQRRSLADESICPSMFRKIMTFTTTYRRKFQDHFGVRFCNWPKSEGKPQGEGFKVAYEPLDIAALPEKQQARYQVQGHPVIVGGRFVLPVPEGTSMSPLREALNEPYRPPIWIEVPDDEEDSDDEGDLFAQSCRQCSGVCPRLDLSVAAGDINDAAEE